jgi:TPR repeat protein
MVQKSCRDRGNVQAQLNLALLAISAKDYDGARRRCESAAKERFPGGEACLGYLYQHGFGVQQDLKAATKYYQLAARQGNPGALHALVGIYSDGGGKKEDRQETFFRLIHFAERGDKQSVIDAQKLRNLMTDKEWKDIQKKLPQYGMDSKQLDAILHADSQPK